MNKIKEIKPPKGFPENYDYDNYRIFTAGSISGNFAIFWQDDFVNKLTKELSDTEISKTTILNPRREDWDNSWSEDSQQFIDQVNWELDAMNISDLIVMYYDPDTKSPISLLELGLYAASGKLVVCCADGFWRKGNVNIVCNRYKVPMVENLEGLVLFAKSQVAVRTAVRSSLEKIVFDNDKK